MYAIHNVALIVFSVSASLVLANILFVLISFVVCYVYKHAQSFRCLPLLLLLYFFFLLVVFQQTQQQQLNLPNTSLV